MKRLSRLPKLCVPLLLGVCSASATSAEPLVAAAVSETQDETILLVSLEDGTVIKQIINVDADICFKQSTSSSTMCLKQGDPIIDATTDTIIGFEMIENRIELVAKND